MCAVPVVRQIIYAAGATPYFRLHLDRQRDGDASLLLHRLARPAPALRGPARSGTTCAYFRVPTPSAVLGPLLWRRPPIFP